MRSTLTQISVVVIILLGQGVSVVHDADMHHNSGHHNSGLQEGDHHESDRDDHDRDCAICLAMIHGGQDALVPESDQNAAVFVAWQSTSVETAPEIPKRAAYAIRPPATGPPPLI